MTEEQISRFTYRTKRKRLDSLKIQAIKEGKPINKLLDDLVDEYLENKQI